MSIHQHNSRNNCSTHAITRGQLALTLGKRLTTRIGKRVKIVSKFIIIFKYELEYTRVYFSVKYTLAIYKMRQIMVNIYSNLH